MERNGGPDKRKNLQQHQGGQNQGRRRGQSAAYIIRDTIRSRKPGAQAHGNAPRQVVGGLRTEVCGQQKQSNNPGNNQHDPQYANYWALLTRKRHIPPHPAQPRHTNHWAPRTRKRHQQEHRPQRPTESSAPTQHAKGRTGDCPGPRKETTTDGMSHGGCEDLLRADCHALGPHFIARGSRQSLRPCPFLPAARPSASPRRSPPRCVPRGCSATAAWTPP